VTAFAELLRSRLTKDPELAAKQARLLEKLRGASTDEEMARALGYAWTKPSRRD